MGEVYLDRCAANISDAYRRDPRLQGPARRALGQLEASRFGVLRQPVVEELVPKLLRGTNLGDYGCVALKVRKLGGELLAECAEHIDFLRNAGVVDQDEGLRIGEFVEPGKLPNADVEKGLQYRPERSDATELNEILVGERPAGQMGLS